jgi:hypothetical protein
LHKGTDVMADEGVAVVAVEAGVIVEVDDVDDGKGGLSLWLRGESGVAHYYAHNSANLVVEGQRVAWDGTITRVGRTGNARTTPPHIHFQINLCGGTSSDEPCTVDPYPYLVQWDQAPIDDGADGTTVLDGALTARGPGGADAVGWYDPASGTFGTPGGSGLSRPALGLASADAQDLAPVAGDWNGDGRASVGMYHRADATFRLFDVEGQALEPVVLGQPGREDVWPVAGDFDGDGRETVGLYRQADATFVVHIDGFGAGPPVPVGTPGRTDVFPVVGDWDGTGRDGLGVYDRDDGTLLLLDDTGAPLPATNAHVEGDGALPVAGDWDGDGRDTVGVLRTDPGTGASTFDLPVRNSDDEVRWTISVTGATLVLPVAGDWDGLDTGVAPTVVATGEVPDGAVPSGLGTRPRRPLPLRCSPRRLRQGQRQVRRRPPARPYRRTPRGRRRRPVPPRRLQHLRRRLRPLPRRPRRRRLRPPTIRRRRTSPHRLGRHPTTNPDRRTHHRREKPGVDVT